MKKFFVKAALLCILTMPTIAAVIFLLPLPKNSYNLAIIDKNQLLENTASPRIILAGGSNLAFGIDSAMIQNRFHLPVINMGLHAGFGLGRIFDDISPFLRGGDILLIIPEYEHFAGGWNGDTAGYELVFDARLYQFLSSSRYGLPKNFSSYLGTHLYTITARFAPPNPLAYSRDGFNEYGDYVNHLINEKQSVTPSKNLGFVNPAYLAWFFQFVDSFMERGIKAVLSYPSYEGQSFRNSAALITDLDAKFRVKENLLVISNPEAYCFSADLFYDTVYHLNAKGRNLRTRQLIEDLQVSGLFN